MGIMLSYSIKINVKLFLTPTYEVINIFKWTVLCVNLGRININTKKHTLWLSNYRN